MKYVLLVLPVLAFSCSMPLQTSQNNISLTQSSVNTGANLSVNISFKDFSTKASSSGVIVKTVNDIKSLKLYLTTSNGANPLLSSNVKFSSGVIVYPTGSATKTYTFFNVPAGTYYVATELFDDITGTNNIVEPTTYDSLVTGDTAFGFSSGKRGVSISTNSATITPPAMSFNFSDNTNAFNLSPKLLNAVGPALGTTISAESGNKISPEPVTIQ